jgi:hypothetical protein
MAALTLIEYDADPRPLVRNVVKILRDDSRWMDVLPFENVGSMSIKVIREGGMPSISWRRPGSAHGSNKATLPTEVEETAFSFGNYIDTDKVYRKDKTPRLYDPRTYQTTMTIRAMAREFNDASINGVPTSTDRPVGLWYRVSNDLGSDQRITADPAGSTAGLDISPDATGLAANIATYFSKLDNLLYALTGSVSASGKGVKLLMNDTLFQRHNAMVQQSGLTDVTKDTIERSWTTYRGAEIIDMGFKIDDSTKIIGNAETLAGTALTGGTGTSIYGVRLGKEYFTGWQEYGLEVDDIGRLDDGVTERILVDWVVGLALSHPRSVARLYGLVAA